MDYKETGDRVLVYGLSLCLEIHLHLITINVLPTQYRFATDLLPILPILTSGFRAYVMWNRVLSFTEEHTSNISDRGVSGTLSNIYDGATFEKIQRQPSRGVLKKRCSENMQQIYRRTPMPKCDFNRVALQLYWNRTLVWVFCQGVISTKLLWNFTEIALWHGCSLVNLLHIFRTPFSKNTSGGLLLEIVNSYNYYQNIGPSEMFHSILCLWPKALKNTE